MREIRVVCTKEKLLLADRPIYGTLLSGHYIYRYQQKLQRNLGQ